jgi:tetratricopeptide (TPR) repeat protein
MVLSVCFIAEGIFISPSIYADSPEMSGLQLSEIFQRGQELYLKQNFTQAETLFRQCVDKEPKNAEYICWLAQSMSYALAEQAMRGASKLALMPIGRTIRDLYFEAVKIDPRSERARLGYAILMRDIPGWLGGDIEKAETTLKKLLEENPHNIFAFHHLGNLYIRNRKEYEKGIEFLKNGLEEAKKRSLTPEEKLFIANTYHALGKVYQENLEDSEKAIPYLKESLAIDEFSVVTRLDLIEAYRSFGQEEEAREVLRTVAEIVRKNKYNRFKRDIELAAKRLKMNKELGL